MKVIISFALVLLLSSMATALPGSKLCSRGPGHWCSTPDAAKRCGATAHCAQLWRNSNLRPAADDVSEACGACQLLATDLLRLAEAGRTPAAMRAAAITACDLVPTRDGRRESCLAAVAGGLADLTAERLQPAKACVLVRQCRRAVDASPAPTLRDLLLLRGAPLSAWKKTRPADTDLCNGCIQVLTAIKTSIAKNTTQATIAGLLKNQVCPQLGPLVELCLQFADQYLGVVLTQLSNDIEPQQTCTLFDFCNATTVMAKYRRHPVQQLMKLQSNPNAKPLATIQCELCEALVNEARQMLREGGTQAEIEKFVEDTVCRLLPAERDQCINNVKEYGPIIFQLLVSELDPQTVCQALGACGAARPISMERPKKLRASTQCLMCEFVIREVEQQLGQNKSQAAIEAALDQVCALLPQTVRKECDNFVQQYTPIIIQLLVNGLGPKTVCTTLGLCTQFRPVTVRTAASAPVSIARASSTACDVCQTVIQYAKALLKENATEQEIVQTLEKVCDFLPTAERAACHSFIEQYGPYVIQLLLQDADPKQICQMLGLCTSKPMEKRQSQLHRQPVGQTLRFVNQHPRRRMPAPNGLVQMVREQEADLPIV